MPHVATMLIAMGCGGLEPTLTVAESDAALLETHTTLYAGLNGFRVDASGQYRTACPFGGEAWYTSEPHRAGQAGADGKPIEVAFDHCMTNDGLRIDGVVEFAEGVQNDSNSPQLHTTLNGTLEFHGPVQGTCDLTVEVVTDAAGKYVDTYGRVCGHNATDIDLLIISRNPYP